MPTGMDRVRGESANGEGREPNRKLRSSNASMDVKCKEHSITEPIIHLPSEPERLCGNFPVIDR
jgi:hypothetical protein